MHRNIWSTTRLTLERPAASAEFCQGKKNLGLNIYNHKCAFISNATEGGKTNLLNISMNVPSI